MNEYYSTCPAGLEGLAAKLAAPSIRGFTLVRMMPGALVYTASPGRVPDCGGFLNTFEVISSVPRSRHLSFAAQRFAGDEEAMRRADMALSRRKFRTYRVMFVEKGALAQVKGDLRAQLERPIRHARVNRETPDTELTVVQRPEGSAYLLLRLTRGEHTRHQLENGELPAQVAWCMAALAKPRRGGVFLDPFAGSGALAAARGRFAPPSALLCFDLDGEAVRKARRRLPEYACCEKVDAFRLDERLDEGQVTELVTEPVSPGAERKPTQYYLDMLRQFAWVLAPGGRLVILVPDGAHFESALSLVPQLSAREKVMFMAGERRMFLYLCVRRGAEKKNPKQG